MTKQELRQKRRELEKLLAAARLATRSFGKGTPGKALGRQTIKGILNDLAFLEKVPLDK